MGIFGSDYPPGCHSVPGDADCFCEVCGLEAGCCECPECPECGQQGRMECYATPKDRGHGLKLSEHQKAVKKLTEFWWQERNREEPAPENMEEIDTIFDDEGKS